MENKTGISFPLQIKNGSLAVSSGSELLKGHIKSWLQTELKERVMRPTYGLEDYLFTSIQDIKLIESNIYQGLTKNIPEASFLVNGILNDSGEAVFYVYWTYLNEESSLTLVI